MKKIAKHFAAVAVTAGALFAGGSVFVPGTAEAHCGGHSNCLGNSGGIYNGNGHCQYNAQLGYETFWYDYDVYLDYCNAPAEGCSGPACLTWPCADGECHGDVQWGIGYGVYGCYSYTYSEETEGCWSVCDC